MKTFQQRDPHHCLTEVLIKVLNLQEQSTILCHLVPLSEARKQKVTKFTEQKQKKDSTNGGGEIMDRVVRIGDEAEEKTTLANSGISDQKNLEGVIVAATANS